MAGWKLYFHFFGVEQRIFKSPYDLPLEVKQRKYYVKPADENYSGVYGDDNGFTAYYSDTKFADNPSSDVPFGENASYPSEWDK